MGKKEDIQPGTIVLDMYETLKAMRDTPPGEFVTKKQIVALERRIVRGQKLNRQEVIKRAKSLIPACTPNDVDVLVSVIIQKKMARTEKMAWARLAITKDSELKKLVRHVRAEIRKSLKAV